MTAPLGVVHAIVDLGVARRSEIRERVRAMLDAGLPSLQLRGIARASEDDAALARWLREETRARRARLIVNADVDLAVAVGADGVHLRADGPSPRELRAELPSEMLVGASCHDEAELERARGADWVFLGPVFPTASKPEAAGLGIERFASLCASASGPVYALGGVSAERFDECIEAGAAGVAAIRACWSDSANALVRKALAARR